MKLRALPLEANAQPSVEAALEIGELALRSQSDALAAVAGRLDGAFSEATRLIAECRGHVVVCGMGKSGLVAQKLSATFCCTGTPSFFLHPAEARHGDLARVRENDVILLISNSGGTEEVVHLLPHFYELGVPLIALVGQQNSTLGRAATVTLCTHVERETCPHNFVPTTSALVSMALGDALAVAVMEARGTTADELLRSHPGGELGRRKTGSVRDKLCSDPLPVVAPEQTLNDALKQMSLGRCGLVVAVDEQRTPVGIITDGDLRRILAKCGSGFESLTVADVMTHDPVTIRDSASLDYAREKMHLLRLKALIVVNDENQLLGVIEVFDSP